jgi:23S rRNA (adenine2503-C2)-methyltransferase
LQSIFDFTLNQLREFFVSNGWAKYGADQAYQWVYQKGQLHPEKWTNLAKGTRDQIVGLLNFHVPKIIWEGHSKDGTRKFLLQMADGNSVEAVIINAKERRTICISSQVGCAIGCKFCHTGTQGLTRHLKASEIVGQLWIVNEFLKEKEGKTLSNIVWMGQGEPLHNYDNTKISTEIFMEPKGFGFGQRKITLSTSGLVPQIEKLGDFPPVNIAISLHAVRDETRSAIMPINKVYDLERLFAAIKKIPLKAHRRITYEYLLIDDFNNSEQDIEGLVKLLDPVKSKVNLIPFNEYPGSDFKRPSDKKIKWFNDELNRRGFTCTIRSTKGTDILAACGQLKSEAEKTNLWS